MKTFVTKFMLTLLIAAIGFSLGLFIKAKTFSSIENIKLHVYTRFNRNKTKRILWNDGFELVKIKSSLDQNIQNAYFYKTKTLKETPLIVSLHSWSGDYAQFDSLAVLCKLKDVNYIHPNFRGPNLTPEACCNTLALNDVDDAISYAIKNSNVDTTKIFVIGASGGAYTALGTFMKSKHRISKFSVWATITDLEAWYNQSHVRGNNYSKDILNCTNSINGELHIENARKRSPFFWDTPKRKLTNTSLSLYAGIYDGIQGPVPITQSINFYNKILSDFSVSDSTKYVSEREKRLLLEYREPLDSYGKLSNKNIALQREFMGLKLIIFEGGHEILNQYALNELIK